MRLLVLARGFVPSTPSCPIWIKPATSASRTTVTKRAHNYVRCCCRNSRAVRWAGKLFAASTRNATSSCSFSSILRDETRRSRTHRSALCPSSRAQSVDDADDPRRSAHRRRLDPANSRHRRQSRPSDPPASNPRDSSAVAAAGPGCTRTRS